MQATWITHDTDLLDVTLRTTNGHTAAAPVAKHSATSRTCDETIHTTANHPWLTADDRGWAQAGALTSSERVVRADGGTAVVVAPHDVAGSTPMYDLTVSDPHLPPGLRIDRA